MTDEELLTGLKRLSKRMRFEGNELWEMARMIAQAEFDPLPLRQWGCLLEDWSREQIFENDELVSLIVNVPRPEACFDFWIARDEFKHDVECAAYALTQGPSLASLIMISENSEAWARLLAARHPNAKLRALFAAGLAETEDLRISNKTRWQSLSARRAVNSTCN
jgi:hypothetical protein